MSTYYYSNSFTFIDKREKKRCSRLGKDTFHLGQYRAITLQIQEMSDLIRNLEDALQLFIPNMLLIQTKQHIHWMRPLYWELEAQWVLQFTTVPSEDRMRTT